MTRYILIDDHSGFVWGDTADLPAFNSNTPPGPDAILTAARMLDESNAEYGLSYEYERYDSRDGSSYYRVYRADVDGTEIVPLVEDGQDLTVIEIVERECDFVGIVRRKPTHEL